MLREQCFGNSVPGTVFREQCSGNRVPGTEFREQCSWNRVSGTFEKPPPPFLIVDSYLSSQKSKWTNSFYIQSGFSMRRSEVPTWLYWDDLFFNILGLSSNIEMHCTSWNHDQPFLKSILAAPWMMIRELNYLLVVQWILKRPTSQRSQTKAAYRWLFGVTQTNIIWNEPPSNHIETPFSVC